MNTDQKIPTEEEIPAEPHSIEPSIQEQILSEMLKGLKDKPEFPLELVDQIEKLGKRSQLQKADEISKVIKSSAGGPHEAA
ncbi:MAG: hypothetical protein KBF64_04220 [Anaerolineaceae bacterium]|nr:hypothetical protein [Anaerolineaceae bacterium]